MRRINFNKNIKWSKKNNLNRRRKRIEIRKRRKNKIN